MTPVEFSDEEMTTFREKQAFKTACFRITREAARIFRESKISDKKSKFFLFYQNIPFCELVSKKIFLSSSDFFSG